MRSRNHSEAPTASAIWIGSANVFEVMSMRLPRVIATACADPAPKQSSDPIGGRAQFMTYAARAMRGLLIDYLRSRQAQKRGGLLEITTLPTELPLTDEDVETEKLAAALDDLAKVDARLAQCVDLKFFCGYSFAQIGELWDVSERTVQRDWDKARVLLNRLISDQPVA